MATPIHSTDAPSLEKLCLPPGPNGINGVRDEDFYFKDGSVVLSAFADPNNKESILNFFRVHMSILARESPVFATMMDLPEPTNDDQDTYDGVPLVHLHDKADHVYGFLRYLYDPPPSLKERYADETITSLVGPLIIAEKYEAVKLKERIISFVCDNWPTDDFNDWKAMEKFVAKLKTPPNPEATLHLSHQANIRRAIQTPLSYVYYHLSCFPEVQFMPSLLQSKDVIYAAVGNRAMRTWMHEAIESRITPCANKAAPCDKNFVNSLILRSFKSRDTSLLSWWGEKAATSSKSGLSGMCNSPICRSRVSEWLHEVVLEAYKKIPIFFPVADWDENGVSDSEVEV